MPKLKTHKGAAKRVRLTATGKIKRGHSHARHSGRASMIKDLVQMAVVTLVSKSDMGRVQEMLPYGRD
jgi:large subunit ribosomal protein L35